MASVLLFSSFPISTLAKEQEDPEVLKLAEDLEFLMEEAAIYDTNNHLVGFDFEKLENKFGNIKEFNELQQEIENGNSVVCENDEEVMPLAASRKKGWKPCMTEALKDHFGIVAIEAVLTGGFWAYLEKKAYKEAAKLLIKIGIGGNVLGATAFLTYYSAKCLKETGWWD
ncbi:hypothetical protein KM914_18160 [Virgibacillus pantothenticus]|nr:hypothetical protein [Virgibacillus pantothenticus]MBU8602210.1 hypothetical protein [Virgibacillus pantothenticus]MBU8636442.1 hypothetical protein [Virgibacillus pantothenticus]MBU8644084.1 hypothetical protein [Virgibacillus pantothenticus]MBU8648323.1 hypothetical protein [Virgibacillus pantothenticus]